MVHDPFCFNGAGSTNKFLTILNLRIGMRSMSNLQMKMSMRTNLQMKDEDEYENEVLVPVSTISCKEMKNA